ncbi:MAG: DNA mismatch endonuclease Vsr [Candidatus Lokiarchaeota archaeon]|nr:DNA mismatch endonuclease Vsr [Candidatus Lokiarchaeota archaeon]
MSKINSKNSNLESIVRKYIFAKGFRFRKNDKRYPGTPDIVLPKYNTAIFVNGCFWHGHYGCRKAKLPKTRTEFWKNKILSNIDRDKKNIADLEMMEWNVITIWQCELRNKNSRKNRLEKLEREILFS